ncbi:ABC transporter permease [Bacillus tropicus]|uniref:ABC transporter permease n=1 Tax=Bacillus cereus group TaxID=86661 RepID=UPI001E46A444|nr:MULTISPECIES: ABC transporter permease [Bacillus cereus group]MCC1485865.1 ABC transporter permease [Bacillus tropicus]MDA1552540.1 ABC transporter permease [Bacillus cereus group sp. TH243-3LC]MDA1563199.1 ABC transporter permease [Bacillus cereus group sp. TH243-1LC]
MKDLLISEFERIFSRKKTKVLLVLFCLLTLLDCFFIGMYGTAVYSSEFQGPLNNLNFPSILAKEIYFILGFLVFPILFIDSLSGELSGGAYRLVLIRSISRTKLLLVKWSAQVILILIFLLIPFIISYIYGMFFIKNAESTIFLDKNVQYNAIESFFYTLKFYGVLFIIASSILMIANFMSLLVINPVVNFLMTVGGMVGSMYIYDDFKYFLVSGAEAFRIISQQDYTFFLLNAIIIVVGITLNLFIWQKKDIYH